MLKMIFIFIMNPAHADDPAADPVAGPVVSPAADAPDDAPDDVVVVTGTRTPTRLSDSPVAVEVIDREALKRSGAATLEQVVEQLPGVVLLPSVRGATLSLRGHAPEHTLVLVDGRRVLGRVGGGFDLSRFPVDQIERIEIVRGSTSALYGSDAIGGVIHIVTRGATAPWQVDAQLTAGTWAVDAVEDDDAVLVEHVRGGDDLDQLGVDVSVGFVRGAVQGRAGVSLLGFDEVDRTPADVATTVDDLRNVAPTAQLTVARGRHRVTLDVAGLMQDGRGVDASATGLVLDRWHRTESWDAGVRTRSVVTDRVGVDTWVQASLYRDQYREDQRGSDALDRYELTVERLGRLGAQVDVRLDAARRHVLVAGVEGHFEGLTADRLEVPSIRRERGALWVEHTWQATSRPLVQLVSGVRLEVDSRFGVFPAPRLAVRVDPLDWLRVRATGGLGFRAPDFRQLALSFANPSVGYRVAGNPDLRPERSVGGTLDVELVPHRVVALTLSLWHDSLTNLIDTALVEAPVGGSPAVYGYVNVGQARVQGVTASVRLGSGPLVANLAYTRLDADDLEHDRPLTGRPEHQGTASVIGRHPRWDTVLSARLAVLGPRPFYPTESLADTLLAPTLGLLDVDLAQPITRHAELFVGVDNLFDAGDRALDATRPRRVYGGLRVSFAPKPQESRHAP